MILENVIKMYALRNTFQHFLELPVPLAVWVAVTVLGTLTTIFGSVYMAATDPSIPAGLSLMMGTALASIFVALTYEATNEASRFIDDARY